MAIYTGTGDKGKTSLFSGERVAKDDRRVEAYGDVDELNSVLGALIAVLNEGSPDLVPELQEIQSDLFHVSALLATTSDSPSMDSIAAITDRQIKRLEKIIDQLDARLPALSGFVLPGGHPSAAWAHIARTVCRRAERHVLRLADDYLKSKAAEPFQKTMVYLNRLSDYLFVLARRCNQIQGVSDTHWKQK